MGKVVVAGLVAFSLAGGAPGQGTAFAADACKDLARLDLPAAKVQSTQTAPAGGFAPPAGLPPWMVGDASVYQSLPAFCRVVVKAMPSPDSDIGIEVWLPLEGWNGRFRGQGNGGFAGQIDFRGLATALAQGYATAATNTGHTGEGTDASWALGHPEKVTDFGYRGIHAMTETAKAAIKAFYGRDAEHSYFGSCSNGGRQALMEAQRYPHDYDGILAGAPANFWTHLLTKALADAQATTVDPASYIPSAKLPAIARAVNAACDADDGVLDGVLNDPRRCRFEPATLACKGPESNACLTAPQVVALKVLYAGPRDSGGHLIFPGYLPGAEGGSGGWAPWITGAAPGKSLLFAFGTGYFANVVYERADWDYRGADLDAALKEAAAKTAAKLDATDANLAPFEARGGKLILYHGWNDPAISALNTIDYYDSVVRTLGKGKADAFTRLYLVPGMQHCGDGPGPHSFGQGGDRSSGEAGRDIYRALEQWVEKGAAPSSIVAANYGGGDPAKGAMATRPLCPYPQVAKYRGRGDTKDAANFVCAPGD
jgi:Tannase and feruloyl esterase